MDKPYTAYREDAAGKVDMASFRYLQDACVFVRNALDREASFCEWRVVNENNLLVCMRGRYENGTVRWL